MICLPPLWPSQGLHIYNFPLFCLPWSPLNWSHGFLFLFVHWYYFGKVSNLIIASVHLLYGSLATSNKGDHSLPEMALLVSLTPCVPVFPSTSMAIPSYFLLLSSLQSNSGLLLELLPFSTYILFLGDVNWSHIWNTNSTTWLLNLYLQLQLLTGIQTPMYI